MTQISLRGIGKTYPDGTQVIKGLDLSIRPGELMVFVGPSGCGKSTILRMIAGLEPITEGDLLVDGEQVNDVGPAERGGAMVFQNYALYPHMTVSRNMGFALEVAGATKDQIRQAVGKAAEILNISHLLDAYPKALSGGERQRVAIGRAIVRKPKFFLFDEPLSNLDAGLRVQLRIELARLHQELKTTMLYVTHDQVEAMTLGSRIAIFRKGRLEQLGEPSVLYANPDNTFVAGFLGLPAINLLNCRIVPDDASNVIAFDQHALACELLPPGLSKASFQVGIRPEHLRIAPGDQPGIEGEVVLTENLGDQAIVYVQVTGASRLLAAKIPATGPLPVKGQRASLQPDWRQAHFFDHEGRALPQGAKP